MSPVPFSQVGATAGPASSAFTFSHHSDHVVTHIAAVVDYAARWAGGAWGPWGSWGTLLRERRYVRVLQRGQSLWGQHWGHAEVRPVLDRGRHVPFAKGFGSPERSSVCVPICWASSLGGGPESTHPQAQDTADIRRVTLLTLQPVHAGTSLWMSSTDKPRPCPPTSSKVTPQHHPTPGHCRDMTGFEVWWVQDVQTEWGNTDEEAMAKGTNKPGVGLTGLPGKPISPFIPALPGGPWKGK